MQEDALYGFNARKFARALGRSVRYNFEIVSHSILNNAFNTAFNGFEAGVSLISTAHTNLRGGTQSNRPAVDADLSLTTLQAAVEAFRAWDTEEGMPMLSTPKFLVVGPANMWVAGVLLGTTQLPGGDFNDINILNRLGLTLIVDDYLTDPDAWYLLGDEHDMNYFDRRLPRFTDTDEFDSDDMKFKVTRRNAAGFGDWRGVYGSPGA
jgi:phage major head subunit gpT-like protein